MTKNKQNKTEKTFHFSSEKEVMVHRESVLQADIEQLDPTILSIYSTCKIKHSHEM